MTRYVISVASLGHYRLRPMRRVKEILGKDLTIYAGDPALDNSIVVLTPRDMELCAVSNRFLPFAILIQNVPLSKLVAAQSLILDLNPRVPHVWFLLLMRKVFGRRTILWGHAFSRPDRKIRSERLRHLMRSLADGILTYTNQQAKELSRIHPRKRIFTAPNALYYRNEIAFDDQNERTNIIFVGRLDPGKKIFELVSAYESIAASLPSSCRLVIVGDGAQRSELEKVVQLSGFQSRIDIMGHVDDYMQLRTLYARAYVSVSPGYVGLSITQSLAFGVPMLISRTEPHSPEIEAAKEGENCLFFETGDLSSLANNIVALWNDRLAWQERGRLIAADCADHYSVEAMSAGIVDALKFGLRL